MLRTSLEQLCLTVKANMGTVMPSSQSLAATLAQMLSPPPTTAVRPMVYTPGACRFEVTSLNGGNVYYYKELTCRGISCPAPISGSYAGPDAFTPFYSTETHGLCLWVLLPAGRSAIARCTCIFIHMHVLLPAQEEQRMTVRHRCKLALSNDLPAAMVRHLWS